jgi:polar amino acid transport system substrate-binding protein/cystine transport system substrate-binding protein/membrane-bound lytic murein transglycosylase F
MRPHGLRRDLLGALPILALLAAVYLLPPDTSLSQARAAGTLRACMPPVHPPFVTGDAAAPGIDVEILRALTRELGLSLLPVEEPAMSRDFNPRSWHLTRAACELVAGGLAASPMTRSFLETSSPYAETGWAALAPIPDFELRGRKVGVLAPATGLDRSATATYLRAQATQNVIVADADALVKGLREGRFEAAVTEKLLADQIAAREHLTAVWLADLPRYPVAFGLWKGDLTLKRAIAGGLDRLERNGTTATILMRYLGNEAARRRTG